MKVSFAQSSYLQVRKDILLLNFLIHTSTKQWNRNKRIIITVLLEAVAFISVVSIFLDMRCKGNKMMTSIICDTLDAE